MIKVFCQTAEISQRIITRHALPHGIVILRQTKKLVDRDLAVTRAIPASCYRVVRSCSKEGDIISRSTASGR